MKSTDNGTTWTKTTIWSSLYNKWVSTGPNDTTPVFYCPDGTNAILLDNNGIAHIIFGLLRASGDNAGKYWYPFTDGIVYWREGFDELPQTLDPDTLFSEGNLIGWITDTIVFYAQPTELAYYYGSLTSQPTLAIDTTLYDGVIYSMWSGVSWGGDQNSYLLRDIFGRGGSYYYPGDTVFTWNNVIADIAADFLYTWSECVYPSASQFVLWYNIYVVVQMDDEAGIYVNGMEGAQGQTIITSNNIVLLNPEETDFFPVGGIEPHEDKLVSSQNFPNPVKDKCIVNVNTMTSGNLSLTVTSMTGQDLYEINKGYQAHGSYQFTIDATNLKPGLYFYTVRVGNYSVTKKMIVRG